MAPTEIAINAEQAPKVSPMREPDFGEHNRELYQKYCQQEKSIQTLRAKYKEAKHRLDRLRNEGSEQKKIILDMSDVVKALHSISIEHEGGEASNEGSSNSDLGQVITKIEAIDKQLKTSMLHTVQLQELRRVATTTIADQEEQIKTLEEQVSLLNARIQHTEKNKDILLPDTSYESQIDSLQKTVSDLQAKIKQHDEDNRNNGLRLQHVSVNKDSSSYSTEDVTSHPSSSVEDEFRMAQERVHELESNNDKLSQDLEESISRMAEVSDSASALQNDLVEMERALQDSLEENQILKEAEKEREEKMIKLEEEVAEAAAVKADFEVLEKTVIAKVEELEKENSLLKAGQQKAAETIMKLKEELTNAESAQQQLQQQNKKLAAETIEHASLIEELSVDAAESDQVKRDFEELERTVIARAEELEIENKALKLEQEEAVSNATSELLKKTAETEARVLKEMQVESFEEAKEKIIQLQKLEEENSTLKIAVSGLEEENDRLIQSRDDQKRESVVTKHPWDKALKAEKDEMEELRQQIEQLKQERDVEATKAIELSSELDAKENELDTVRESLQEENDRLRAGIQNENKSTESTEKLMELEAENQRLRETMLSSKEADRLRSDCKTMKKKLKESKSKLNSLQEEYSRTLMQLNDRRETDSDASSFISQRSKKDTESFEKFKRMHQAVAVKLADLGEDNAILKDQLDQAQAKLVAQKHTVSILATVKKDYAMLMEEYDQTVTKLNSMASNNESMEILQQDYADARAKIAVLQWENDELSRSREMFHNTEARITLLERQVEEANANLNSEKQRSADHMNNANEVSAAYKQLEEEHKEVTEKVQSLQAMLDGEAKKKSDVKKWKAPSPSERAKLEMVENQRNVAWEEVKKLEKKLSTEKTRYSKASTAKKAREGDLKLVLQEYASLQTQYEKAKNRVHELKDKNRELKREKKRQAARKARRQDQPIEIIVLDDVEEGNVANITVTKKPQEPQDDVIDVEEIREEEEVVEETEDVEIEEDEVKVRGEDAPGISNELAAIWKNFGIAKKRSGDGLVGGERNTTTERQGKIPATPASTPVISNGQKKSMASKNNDDEYADVEIQPNGEEMSTISQESFQMDFRERENAALKELESKHQQALDKLERTERELLVVKREAEEAKQTQVSREVKLRNTTSKLFKLEREHAELTGVVSDLKKQVTQAKNESKAAEAEVKGIRLHLEQSNADYVELQERHESFMRRFSEADANKMEELVKENEDMNAFCKEFLTTIADIKDEDENENEGEEDVAMDTTEVVDGEEESPATIKEEEEEEDIVEMEDVPMDDEEAEVQ